MILTRIHYPRNAHSALDFNDALRYDKSNDALRHHG